MMNFKKSILIFCTILLSICSIVGCVNLKKGEEQE